MDEQSIIKAFETLVDIDKRQGEAIQALTDIAKKLSQDVDYLKSHIAKLEAKLLVAEPAQSNSQNLTLPRKKH